MYRAVDAGRLGFAEDASLQTPARVLVQLGAMRTKRCVLCAVMRAAIHAQHSGDHLEFARAPAALLRAIVRSGYRRHARALYWY
jgi:hypothetical protein